MTTSTTNGRTGGLSDEPILSTLANTPAGAPTFLYYVAFIAADGVIGSCYVDLTRPVTTRADVRCLRDDLRMTGPDGAILLSFTLLTGGWGTR